MAVGWKSAGQKGVSRVDTVGLGGFYLYATNPPSEGSAIDLILDLPAGTFRARAIVRRSTPGKGMGVQFVQMSPWDRAKLHQYLSRQDFFQDSRAVAPADSLRATADSSSSQLIVSPRREEAAQLRFEREGRQLLELTQRGTYYQLLGVTSECPHSEVKKGYYALARKFHPDSQVGYRESIAPLSGLMTIITEAYRTLANEEKRAAYDKSLAAMGVFSIHREKTGTEDSIEEWLKRASKCLHAKNFLGSIIWLRKCIEAAPEQALYHALLARSLGTLPHFRNEAIEHFRKAIDLDPWRAAVYVELAELYEEMRLRERARDVYFKLLEIDPAHAKACERLATLEAEEKDEKGSSWISHLFGRKS